MHNEKGLSLGYFQDILLNVIFFLHPVQTMDIPTVSTFNVCQSMTTLDITAFHLPLLPPPPCQPPSTLLKCFLQQQQQQPYATNRLNQPDKFFSDYLVFFLSTNIIFIVF